MSDGSDLAWLGLERRAPGRWTFELTSPLTRHDAKLYGGTGAAVMAAMMEAETARDALWLTVQFVGSADQGERIDCDVEVVAGGKRTSQLRMTATAGDQLVLAGIGATGMPRPEPVEAQIPTMPDVPRPDECGPWGSARPGVVPPTGFLQLGELRQIPDSASLWARWRQGSHTRATVAFLADMVPTGVLRATGRMGGGTSLDNSMRFGRPAETEWVLIDMDPWLATGGYLHGAARVWSEDGTLVAIASQTAAAMVMPSGFPIAPPS